MSRVVHAFVNEEGLVMTPAKAIMSYCFLDQLIDKPYSYVMSTLQNLKTHFEEENDGECPHQEHKLLGAVIRTLAEKAKCYKKDATLKGMKARRPLHYRDNDYQFVYWVSGETPGHDTEAKPYAVLFDVLKDDAVEANDEVIYHDGPEETVNAHIRANRTDDNPGIRIGGFMQTYFQYFGGNESFMYSHCAIESLPDRKKVSRAELAHDAFSKWRKENYHAAIRDKVLACSKLEKYGYTTLKVASGKAYKVPTLPLMAWALRRLNDDLYTYHEEWAEYKAVSTSGMKTGGDDPLHTDWLIAGGVGISYRENREATDAASEWAEKWQNAYFQVKNHVLSVGRTVKGRIFHATPDNATEVQEGDILVLPEGSQDYHVHAMKACGKGRGGVITEVGGRAAHLVKVSGEMGYSVLRIPDARKQFPHLAYAHLSARNGEVYIESTECAQEWLASN